MTRSLRANDPDPLVQVVIQGIQEVKGQNIVKLDMRNVPNAVTDHFVICHGSSDRQVAAIAGSVEKFTKETLGEKPWHVEGQANAEWILMDYVNVVVHIFKEELREHYALEELWGDADRSFIENVA